MSGDLYVSTALAWWEAPVCSDLGGRTGFAPVVTQDGVQFRRLNAAFYAWLAERVGRARAAGHACEEWEFINRWWLEATASKSKEQP